MNKAKEAEIRAEVETLRSLDKDALRVRWSKMFGKVAEGIIAWLRS